jgi:hypothetical protein
LKIVKYDNGGGGDGDDEEYDDNNNGIFSARNEQPHSGWIRLLLTENNLL